MKYIVVIHISGFVSFYSLSTSSFQAPITLPLVTAYHYLQFLPFKRETLTPLFRPLPTLQYHFSSNPRYNSYDMRYHPIPPDVETYHSYSRHHPPPASPLYSIKQDLTWNRQSRHFFTPEDPYPAKPRSFQEFNAQRAEREVRIRRSRRKLRSMPGYAQLRPDPPAVYREEHIPLEPVNQVESMYYLGTDDMPPLYQSRRWKRREYTPPESPAYGGEWRGSNSGYDAGTYEQPSPPRRLRRVSKFCF